MMTARTRTLICYVGITLAFGLSVQGGPSIARRGQLVPSRESKSISEYVAYWSFDEAAGLIAHDESPLGLDGDLRGGHWGEGISGSGVDLNGVNEFISIVNGGVFPSEVGDLTEGTISIWFKFDEFTTEEGTIHPVVFAGSADGSSGLIIEAGHFSSLNAKLYFTIYNGAFIPQCFDTGFDLRPNVWYHFAAVVGVDFNTGYLNGVELVDRHYNWGDASSAYFFSDVMGKSVFWLGRGYLNERTSDQYLGGSADEFRIYDRPLTSDEIREYYESVTGSSVGCQLDPAIAPDLDGDGVPDECCVTSVPAAPSDAVATNRYLGFQLAESTTLQAVRVTLKNLPPPYDVRNGDVMWVGPPRSVSELPGVYDFTQPTFKAATLQCDPFFGEFGSIGAVYVYHHDIIPDATYELQAIKRGCGMSTDFNFSAPAEVRTTTWGDVTGRFDGTHWPSPDGQVDLTADVLSILDKFRNSLGAPVKVRADLHPATPDRKITISDVIVVVDSFRGIGYPFGPVPSPCDY